MLDPCSAACHFQCVHSLVFLSLPMLAGSNIKRCGSCPRPACQGLIVGGLQAQPQFGTGPARGFDPRRQIGSHRLPALEHAGAEVASDAEPGGDFPDGQDLKGGRFPQQAAWVGGCSADALEASAKFSGGDGSLHGVRCASSGGSRPLPHHRRRRPGSGGRPHGSPWERIRRRGTAARGRPWRRAREAGGASRPKRSAAWRDCRWSV